MNHLTTVWKKDPAISRPILGFLMYTPLGMEKGKWNQILGIERDDDDDDDDDDGIILLARNIVRHCSADCQTTVIEQHGSKNQRRRFSGGVWSGYQLDAVGELRAVPDGHLPRRLVPGFYVSRSVHGRFVGKNRIKDKDRLIDLRQWSRRGQKN